MTNVTASRRKKSAGASSSKEERSIRSSFFAKYSKPLEAALAEYLKQQ